MSIDNYLKDMKFNLSWGILFHLQGRQENAKESLQKVEIKHKELKSAIETNGEILEDNNLLEYIESFKDVSNDIQKYIDLMETRRPYEEKQQERRDVLISIIDGLGRILRPEANEASHLYLECDRSNKKGAASDNQKQGYSRDPFKIISDPDLKLDVALAAVVYLLRGYAVFFCRPKNLRDFNAAKVALNDFFQCGQLAWRLYRSLESCHAHKGNQDKYHINVRTLIKFDVTPAESEYFIWNTLLMLEIQRGNVYRQIDNLDEASRFFRHAKNRLERLGKSSIYTFFTGQQNAFSSNYDKFVTPTVIRALSELSKVQFDLGYFLETLINQLLPLACLVETNLSINAAPKNLEKEQLLKDLLNVIKFLDSERQQMIFDTELIGEYFGYPGLNKTGLDVKDYIKPNRFKALIAKKDIDFAVDVLARIGFVLFTLRRRYLPIRKRSDEEQKNIFNEQLQINEWLKNFFNAQEDFKVEYPEVKPSPLGQYCLSLVGYTAGEVALVSLERKFAHRLRENVTPQILNQIGLTEQKLYGAILASTTENVINVATIPRRNQRILMRKGYRFRREGGDLSQDTVTAGVEMMLSRNNSATVTEGRSQNKLVVLRRWQSTNPKFPRPGERKLRGGGYFLLWQGKGIVIDPGYDFIQNFYEEGFSLADIDAVLVTHSHPDHDDDLSTLTTLIREWNEYYLLSGQSKEKYGNKKLDFFLNESTNLKFSAWLKSSNVKIGRVIPLPSVWWDKDSKKTSDGKIRGKPVIIDLRNPDNREDAYNLMMEVVPAWHDDVIGKTEAVGIKFHLNDPDSVGLVGIVGYTGDTGAYGHDLTGRCQEEKNRVGNMYADCDVLIAHLGDIKIRELTTLMGELGGNHPIQMLFDDCFHDPINPNDIDKNRNINDEQVRDFLRFLIALDLVPHKALLSKIKLTVGDPLPICEWLNELTKPRHDIKINITAKDLREELEKARKDILDQFDYKQQNPIISSVTRQLERRIELEATGRLDERALVSDKRLLWALLGFLCGSSMIPWQYPYHLGIFGLYQLFNAMVLYWKDKKDGRLFIVGELPEELSSYRQQVARRLNLVEGNLKESKSNEVIRWVHALTGDIGLHVSINPEDKWIKPKIRCAYCNYNNETLLKKENYHEPSKILETPLKRLNSAMIYLCTKYDHYPEIEDFPTHFLSRPNLRII